MRIALVFLLCTTAAAQDWPTWMHDMDRSGRTASELKLPLHRQWSRRAPYPPSPAWPPPAKQDLWHNKTRLQPRVVFDRAFQTVIAQGLLVYGSSSDNAVHALDAETGEPRWRFFTEGPVRLAPTLYRDRAVFGSDDGHCYAVELKTGKLAWKTRVAEAPERRLPGNGRLMSPWPLRTGVLVDGDTGYFGAGLFPQQGAWHCSIDLRNGKVLDRKPLQVSPQGYIEFRKGNLFLPTGRNPAGAFVSGLKRRGEANEQVKAISRDYPYAFIGTPSLRIGGGDGIVAVFDAETGMKQWSAEVEGAAWGLAVAGNRLYVSTSTGMIYAFGTEQSPVRVHAESLETIEATGDDRGYVLLMRADAAGLRSLAATSGIHIVAVAESPEARTALQEAAYRHGLAGRVAVMGWNGKTLPVPDRLFNRVVNGEALPEAERKRVRQGDHHPPGSAWTHLYADPANTACSRDGRIGGGNLALQWFGEPGPQLMVDRHLRTMSSLVFNGMMFVPGHDRIFGVDAFNGTVRWEKEVPGLSRMAVFRDCGSMAVNKRGLYVSAGPKVWLLDHRTGGVSRMHNPPVPGDWAYLSVQDEQVIGSVCRTGASRREMSRATITEAAYYDARPLVVSHTLFALEQWTRPAERGAIVNQAIALGNNHVYFVESNNPATLEVESGRVKPDDLFAHSGAELVALNLADGQPAWRTSLDLKPGIHNLYVSYAADSDRVAVVNSRNAEKLVYDIQVFDAEAGAPAWTDILVTRHRPGGSHGEQDKHPVIIGDRLIVEPRSYALKDGSHSDLAALNHRKHGCGTLTASLDALFFRSKTASRYVLGEERIRPVTAISRPGCWINMIPAGGLLLIPESSSGCTCNFAVQSSMAFGPE